MSTTFKMGRTTLFGLGLDIAMDTIRVFVSSTYIDLKEHRANVDEIINRMCAQFRGMEYIGSRPFEPKTACFREIDNCHVFVGIYAHRYGHIPDGERLSITELEFDHALEKGLECYCYVVDPEQPWPPKYIESKRVKELKALTRKVRTLVKSNFTTPDDLAKKVAADLKLRTGTPGTIASIDDLKLQLKHLCKHEIRATIGPKYINSLYVRRSLSKAVETNLKRAKTILRNIESLSADCEELFSVVSDFSHISEGGNLGSRFKDVTKSLRTASRLLSESKKQPISSAFFCYPANAVFDATSLMANAVAFARRKIVPYAVRNNLDGFDSTLLSDMQNKIDNLQMYIRPIFLIIDRAGGGKTNLLCALTKSLACDYPCMFIAGKSVYPADENSIANYLRTAYPIAEDPMREMLDHARRENTHAVLVLDGINENLNPLRFNSAIQSFVRKYHEEPIRYVVSCRDIYWAYFKGEFWDSHCAIVSRDKLYSFTSRELGKAMPAYFDAFDIEAKPVGNARIQLRHPLLLRFYCEAFKGSPGRPTVLGKVDDIRLLELFDEYCERKFDQIRARLGLASSQEIYECICLVALEMLKRRSRLLPVSAIAELTRMPYDQISMRAPDSWYVQILDEDILLEEKPEGPKMNIKVGFVYDEFMEYTIANALWSRLTDKCGSPSFTDARAIAESVLDCEEEFISAAGVTLYLGEMLSRVSRNEGLKYVDWLITTSRTDLACSLIVRWPKATMDDTVFQKLIGLHDTNSSNYGRLDAWKAMEQICLGHWAVFFHYIYSMRLKGQFRPAIVFPFLSRVHGGPDPNARIETLRWIECTITEHYYMVPDQETRDFQNGIRAMRSIIESAKSSWDSKQSKHASQLLRSAIQTGRDFSY